MKRNYPCYLILIIFLFISPIMNALAAGTNQYAKGRLMVKFSEAAIKSNGFQFRTDRGIAVTGLASLDALNAQYKASDIKKAHPRLSNQQLAYQLGLNRWYIVTFPDSEDMVAMAAFYKKNPDIEEATPDWRAYPVAPPDDPHYTAQWGHDNTGQFPSFNSITGQHDGPLVGTVGFDGRILTAWNFLGNYGSSGITIGIIDSGVDLDHPDLAGNLVTGYDFGSNDGNPDDNSAQPGHGTACAGVAAARTNNGIGVAGVAGGCKIMPLKVADNNGDMYFSAIQSALYYAADHSVKIVSMSLGNSEITSDPLTDAALQYAFNHGVTLLAATGNENTDHIGYPACNLYVIGVGAASPCNQRKSGISCDGESWWGSNYGVNAQDASGAVDIIAPCMIPTTDIAGAGGYNSGDYDLYFNGTSSATPFAAGVCALILSQHPAWTPAQVRQQLVTTASDVVSTESGTGWDRFTGYGMVNAYAALTTSPPANNPPVFTATGPFTLPGFAAEGTSVGNIDANNGDGGATDAGITYSVQVNVNPDGDGIQAFAINPTTGVLTVADANDLNDVLNPSLTITIQADDGIRQSTAEVTIILSTPPAGVIRYVDGNVSGGANNGSSWQNAYNNLQTALSAAVSGDALFVKHGTYKPTTGTDKSISFNIPSGVAVYGHFAGNETAAWQRALSNPDYETILSGDIGVEGTNTDNTYHVVTFRGVSSTTRLDGFTITKGYALYVNPDGSFNKDDERNCAGGILNASGYPDIRNCLITSNVAAVYGGGMFTVNYTTPTLTDCRFISNSVGDIMPGWGGRGGGISASGCNVIVRNSIFRGNYGLSGAAIDNTNSCSNRGRGEFYNCIFENSSGGSEAAFVNWGADPVITGCTIRNNPAITGGGMCNYVSYPVITDCLFENNSALYYYDLAGGGGGMYNYNSFPTITGCTFLNNHGTFGAAILNKDYSSPVISRTKFISNTDGSAIYNANNSNPVITSCLISGNNVASPSWYSATLAGGISNINSSPTIINCTFSGNQTNRKGGAMYNENASPVIKNTIIWDNAATMEGNEVCNTSSSPVFSYCSVKGCGGSGGTWNSLTGSDGGNNMDANPAFMVPVPPSAAPTTLGDYHFYQHSPVIDAGNNAAISETLDLDGNARVQNGTVDLGPYEGGTGRILFVKADATGSNTGANWANAFTDLQDALDIATSGSEIYVAGGTYKPGRGSGSRTASFAIPDDIKVYGHFAGTETSYFDRPLADPAHETILSGDIGSAGYADNSYHVMTFVSAGDSALLDGFTITQGNADGTGDAASGGGVFIRDHSPTLRNNIIAGNIAVYGGGIAATGPSSPALINCVLLGNSATYGGAMSSSASTTPELTNCSFSGNNAATSGGALYNLDASPVTRNSIIWGNNPAGGVIYNSGSASPSFSYCNLQASGGSAGWNSAYGQDGGHNADVDPLFVAGPDYTTAPTTLGQLLCYKASPMVNAGNNSYLAADTWFDIAGLTRIQNGTVDMGAYEGNNSNYIFYVKGDATGANSGKSWANAFTNLQSALIRVSGGDKVYVARGTYLPTTTTDRSVSFRIPSGVEVYGHFSGTENGPDQRVLSVEANKTVLSGDIGTQGDNGDNTYHVVVFSWASASTLLDGVTLTGGNAASEPNDCGGGILVGDASPLIRNCIISGNNAVYGGGMSVSYTSRPTLVNCIFNGNHGTVGYAIFSGRNSTEDRSAFNMINCVVYGNSCNQSYYSDAAITSMFSNYWGFHPQIKNTIIWGNADLPFNGYWQGNAEFYNCNVQGSGGSGVWSLTYGMDKGGNIAADPLFVDPGIGNFRIQELSPCINAGNNSYVPASTPFDLDGAVRIQGNVDMGAYEKTLLLYLSTARISAITKTSATGGGSVDGTEASTITIRGVCWNTSGSPTISDNKTEDGSGGGSFTSNMTGLSQSSLYYVRAYATDGVNTYYGDEILFTTEMDPPGYALNFDGTNDYVSLPDETAFDFTGSLTVEVWLKVGSFDKSWQTIIAKGDNSWRIARYPDTDRLDFTCSGLSTGSVTGNIDVNDGEWHHIAGVYNGTTLALYVDGVLDNSVGTSGTISNSGYPVYIGENSQATGRYFNGRMDEIRIWNVARTPEQIAANRNNIIDPGTANLVAYYRFDELAGSTLRDLTPNGHEGVLKNMTNANWVPSGAMQTTVTYTVTYNGNGADNGTVPEAQIKTLDVNLVLASNTGNLQKTGFTFTGWNTQADGNGADYDEGGEYTANTSVTLYAKWTVACTNPDDGGEIAAGQANCGSFTPAQLTSESGPTGMAGTLEYKWQKSTTSSKLGFADIEGTNSDTYSPGSVTQTTWYKRMARVTCMTDWTGAAESNVVEMTVEQPPVSGTMAKTPNATNACEGANVSATLTAGSGGNGSDSLAYRTHNGTSWSEWVNYATGTDISTTGKTQVEIVTLRKADYCIDATGTTVSWIVEQTPVTGTLAKTPNLSYVCEGDDVSATLTTGSGGNGSDSLAYRTHNGTDWSSWTNYTTGTNISTVDKTQVEILTLRKADHCSDAAESTVSWAVEQTPATGTLAKTPNVTNVCENEDVSAALTAGSGGSGTDELESRTQTGGSSWSGWTSYTSGTAISTTGKSAVEIRTRRLTTHCATADYVMVSWSVEQTPVSGVLAKNPDLTNVNPGSEVTASLTPGSGGNGNDILEFRILTATTWSDWASYLSGEVIPTAGISGLEVQTYREANYCNDAYVVHVAWVIDPTTVGGAVTGGTQVCHGSNSTLLTLSGYVGIVQRWEWSTNGIDWNVIANTAETYTATDLTENTWFRAVVKSGVCLEENSAATQITMFTDYRISGYAKYNNNSKTPLNGLKITLKQSGTPVGSPYITGTTGYYEFTGLTNGTYDLEIASANPGGWLTWSGVNNTDYLLVARHAANGPYLSVDPPVVRVAADVKAPSTPPVITAIDAQAIRYAAKYGWGSPTPYFDTQKWLFSGPDASSDITSVELNCADVTRNILGLCAGDVNGSYVPPYGIKQATPGVEIVNSGLLDLTEEMVFPVRAESDMEIGAITLMLDFDASQLEITTVEMTGQVDAPYFFVTRHPSRVTEGVLSIGWMSMNPLQIAAGETVMLIHARLISDEIRNPKSEIRIRFSLNENPVSELADAEGNVIEGAKLAVADAGHPSPVTRHENLLSVYPNPVSELLTIEYLMESDGMFCAELMNPQGVVVMRTDKTSSPAGLNKTTMNLRELPNGAYLLKAVCGESSKTVKVIVNR